LNIAESIANGLSENTLWITYGGLPGLLVDERGKLGSFNWRNAWKLIRQQAERKRVRKNVVSQSG